MSKKRILPIGIVIALALAAGIIGLLVVFRSQGNDLRVRLTWLHQAQFAGVYLAEDQGYYSAEGIKVAANPGGIEYSSVKMVSAGADDIGLTSADQVLLARAKGVPLVALAALYQKSPVVLFSLKKTGIQRPEDLRGKKIGIKYGDNTEVPVRALLRKFGIQKADYEEVSVSYDPSVLVDGRVDVLPGFALNEPVSLQEKGYDLNIIYLADYGINFYADVIFTTENTVSKKKDAVDKFLRATLKGYAFAIAHPDDAVTSTIKRNPEASRAHELEMVRISSALWKPGPDKEIGVMTRANWEDIQQILLSFELLKEPLDIGKVVDFKAAEREK